MTTSVLNFGYQPFIRTVNTGSSPEAKKFELQTERVVAHFRDRASRQRALQELHEVWSRQGSTNQNGNHVDTIARETYELSKRFLNCLPSEVCSPEVSADPDGEISLDWYEGPTKQLSVSIGPGGKMTYAGIFGQGIKAHGTEAFDDAIPATVFDGIRRVYRR